jgi:methenyltetrahydrofolate cyclohydrolase
VGFDLVIVLVALGNARILWRHRSPDVTLDLVFGGLGVLVYLLARLILHADLRLSTIGCDANKTGDREESSLIPEFVTRRLIEGISELSEALAAGDAEPAGGPVAALVAVCAASLAAAAADRSRGRWGGAGGARAQAQALRRRALGLAERDLSAYTVARTALAERGDPAQPDRPPGNAARDWRLGEAIRHAAGPPLELAACADDIAQLAQLIASNCAEGIRADAAIAAMLAAGAASSAAHLVEINLVVGGDAELSARARAHADAALAAAGAATRDG